MFPLDRSSTDTILPGVLIEQREEDEPGEEGLQQENVPEEGREFEETLTIPISARTHHERIPAACLSHPCSPPLNQSLSVRPSQPLRQTAVVNKPTLTPNNTSQRAPCKSRYPQTAPNKIITTRNDAKPSAPSQGNGVVVTG